MVSSKSRNLIASLLALGVIAGGVLWFAKHRGPASGGNLPPATNIILITIDTTRADAVGYAGNATVKTPFLDSLAAGGMVFTNAHAHNVITLPSHVNILTGLYPFQ